MPETGAPRHAFEVVFTPAGVSVNETPVIRTPTPGSLPGPGVLSASIARAFRAEVVRIRYQGAVRIEAAPFVRFGHVAAVIDAFRRLGMRWFVLGYRTWPPVPDTVPRLPRAATAPLRANRVTLMVVVEGTGIFLNGKKVAGAAPPDEQPMFVEPLCDGLMSALKQATQMEKPFRVVLYIAATEQAPFGLVMAAIRTASRAGIARYRLLAYPFRPGSPFAPGVLKQKR